jgi:DNA-binding CsgD family transcriptional regulator
LHDRVRTVGRGEGAVVLIDGTTGTGKSRFILDAVVAATTLGSLAAMAAAEEHDPLSVVVSLLAGLGGSVGALPANAVETGTSLFELLRTTLEEGAAGSPVLVALDDLQWANRGTLQAVQRLTDQLASYPILWVLAGRGGDPASSLERAFAFLETKGAVRLGLPALSPQAVSELIGDIIGADPPDSLLAMAEGAGGNPGLLVELTEGLLDEGAVEVTDGAVVLVSSQLPRRLQAIVAYRLDLLSPETRNFLDVAAVVGRSFSMDIVAAVLGEPMARLLPAVQEARSSGVLVSTGTDLSFRHDLVRSAVYEGIPESDRVALHRELGEVLLERGGMAVAAAMHLLQGARPGDRHVLAALDRATDEMRVSSPDSAADFAVRAVELADPADADRFTRVVTAVDALVAAGRLDHAVELAQASLNSKDVPVAIAVRLRLVLSSAAFMGAQLAVAVAQADAVLGETDVDVETYAAARLSMLAALMAGGDYMAAREVVAEIVAGSSLAGGDGLLAGALATMGGMEWADGRVHTALTFLRGAVARAEQDEVVTRHIHPRQSLAVVLGAIGEFTEAEHVLAQDAVDIDRLGGEAWRAALAVRQARLHMSWGRFVEAQAEAEAGLAMAQESGARVFIPFARATLAGAMLRRGALDSAADEVRMCRAELGEYPDRLASSRCDVIQSQIACAGGGPRAALEVLGDLYTHLLGNKRLLLEDPMVVIWLVRVALAVGDRSRAELARLASAELAASNPSVTFLAAAASHVSGLIDHDVSALRDAATSYTQPWARAAAIEDTGELASLSDRAGARGEFLKALESFEGMGAVLDAERVRARLRAVGFRRSRQEIPVEGWTSLTDTERHVAKLVSDSLTNPQIAERMFLSRHTVDFHLRQIFRKLTINSRVELTRVVLQQDEA